MFGIFLPFETMANRAITRVTKILSLVFAILHSTKSEVLPSIQWPLVDTSGLADVINGTYNLKADGGKQCFHFGERFEELGYDAMKLGESSAQYLTCPLIEFKDLTISFLIYTESDPVGTILHYTVGEKDFFRVMFHPLAPITFVSFRDQYDNPAGIITIQNLLTLNTWNHVVIQRKYDDGHVRVYSNGILVADKDEMDEIGLPKNGALTIGNSLNDLSQQFTGYVSCLQIFSKFLSEAEMEGVWKLCKKERWQTKPEVYVIDDIGTAKKCLTDVPPPPPPAPFTPSEDNFLSVTSLVNENLWRSVRNHYKWEDTGITSGYFYRVTTDGTTANEVISMASVNTTDLRTCSRICMRIKGCKTFGFEKTLENPNRNPCVLYDVSHSLVGSDIGYKYFAIRQ